MIDTERTVAIIIPTLNEERYIADCIDSVVNQSFPFELVNLVIVDGGSSDRTCAIVEDFIRRYSNISLLHNPQKIQSIAFNIGVSATTEPYVIRLDAHALYDRLYVEKCIKWLEVNENYGNVGGRWIIKSRTNALVAQANAILNQSKFGIGGAAYRTSETAGCVDTVPFGAFRRTVIEQIGGMRDDLARGEDNEYNNRIRKAGYQIYFDPSIVAIYFSRETVSAAAKQMYANGKSIGVLVHLDITSVGFRHLVPLAFVLVLFLGGIGALFSVVFAWILLTMLVLYFLCAMISTVYECRKFGWRYAIILPCLYFITHISYGLGTIVGLCKGLK